MVHNPKMLKETVEVASRIEIKYELLAQEPKSTKNSPSILYKPNSKTISWTPQKPYNPISNSKTSNEHNNILYHSKPTHTTTKSDAVSSSPNWSYPQFRRLTPAEAQSRREKGMCFCCDEKWLVSHQCKKKELHVLLFSEGDGIWDEAEEME